MNRADQLEHMLRANGGRVPLWQILERRDGLSCKYTQAISELRKKLAPGETVVCIQNPEQPTHNIYELQRVMDGQQRVFL